MSREATSDDGEWQEYMPVVAVPTIQNMIKVLLHMDHIIRLVLLV